MKHTYTNWSYKIFEGFYESNLFNSDILWCITQNDINDGYLQENQYYDIDNFNEFQNKTAKLAVDILNENINSDDGIIKDLKFKSLYSPKFYNYETDALIMSVNLNLSKLKKFCFKTHRETFDKYLKDNFTSYDGFTSFVSNNVNDFECDFKNNISNDRELNAMIEYYLLTCIYNSYSDFDGFDTSYHYSLHEDVNELIYNSLSIHDDVV